jgi:glutamyl-tRNA reductase
VQPRHPRKLTVKQQAPSAGVEVVLRASEQAGGRDDHLRVLVLGAGVMAKAALARLAELGPWVTPINPTIDHAQQLAHAYRPRVGAAGFHALAELLTHADLVVCATALRQPVLDCATQRAKLWIRIRDDCDAAQ